MNYNPDLYWKGGIEDVFPELLCLIFPNAAELFDLERKPEFLDKELLQLFPEAGSKSENRHVDKLVRIYGKEGMPELLLLHVEVQGYQAGDFGHRMFTYFYRLFEKYKIPITSASLFTTKKKPENAGFFKYEMLGTTLHFGYNSLHIFDYSEAELLAMKSGLGIMILAAQKSVLRVRKPKLSQQEALNQQRLMLVKALFACNQYDKKKILGLISFVKNVIHIDNPEINHIFDEEISSLNKNIGPMGILELMALENIEKGIKIGEEKTLKKLEMKDREFVISLIEQLGLEDEMAAGVAKVSVEYVQQIRKELEKAKNPK